MWVGVWFSRIRSKWLLVGWAAAVRWKLEARNMVQYWCNAPWKPLTLKMWWFLFLGRRKKKHFHIDLGMKVNILMLLFTIIDYYRLARKWPTFHSLHRDSGHVSKGAALTCNSLVHMNSWECWSVHACQAGHYNDIPLEHEQSINNVHHRIECSTNPRLWLVSPMCIVIHPQYS